MLALPEQAAPVWLDRYARSALVWLWAILVLVILARGALQPHRATVYPIFAHAGLEWRHSADLYDYQPAGSNLDWFRYAPAIAAFFAPLSLLPDALAGLLWRGLNATVFLAGFVVFVRAVDPGRAALTARGSAALGLLLVPLSLSSLNNAQANPLVIGLLLFALASAARRHWTRAAICLAIPILFKLYPLAVALLLVLLYPRQLSWRLALCLLVGALVPFALQEPDYVLRQYRGWFDCLAADDRRGFPLAFGYRDFHTLARFAGLSIPARPYLALQLASAAGVAALLLWERWRGLTEKALLGRVLDLGCCWMILLGPATESCTYILLAPTLALAGWRAWRPGRPLWTRAALTAIVALFAVSVTATAFPFGRYVAFALHPLAALLLFGERLAGGGTPPVRAKPVEPADTARPTARAA